MNWEKEMLANSPITLSDTISFCLFIFTESTKIRKLSH